MADMENATGKWISQTKGGPGKESFEISVIREDNDHGRRSYGWFNKNKLLVTHNGGHCSWPLTKAIWKACVEVAEKEAERLNKLEATKNENGN